jgi:hypothetical protein
VDVIFLNYYKGDKIRGAKDPDFVDGISLAFVCLVCTGIWFVLRCWTTGDYVEVVHFNPSQNMDIMCKASPAL